MKKNKTKDSRPFSERHPRWNLVLGLLLVLILIGLGLLLRKITFILCERYRKCDEEKVIIQNSEMIIQVGDGLMSKL